MKTAHFSFPTGLVAYEYEPYTNRDVLEYNGRFYVVGSGRQPLQKDKTRNEDYFLLTLAAAAKELAFRGADRTAAVHLAAGLPLTDFGRDKKKFTEYLHRDGNPITFRYEGCAYTLTIEKVSLFPQGYAAVLTQIRKSNRSPAQRVRFESEEQGSVCSFRHRRKRNKTDFATSRGAALMKRHGSPCDGACRAVILDDVCRTPRAMNAL